MTVGVEVSFLIPILSAAEPNMSAAEAVSVSFLIPMPSTAEQVPIVVFTVVVCSFDNLAASLVRAIFYPHV